MSLSDDLSSQTHWRMFMTHSLAEPFHCFHVHIKTWWPTKWWPIEWKPKMSLSDDLLSQTHWRRFVTHSLAESFHCFRVHIKNMVTDRMRDQRSLADDLSSRTHWKRFMMRPSAESFQYGNKIRIDRGPMRNDNFQIKISQNSCPFL